MKAFTPNTSTSSLPWVFPLTRSSFRTTLSAKNDYNARFFRRFGSSISTRAIFGISLSAVTRFSR